MPLKTPSQQSDEVRQNVVKAGKFHRKSLHMLKQSSVFTSSITRSDQLYSSIQRRRNHMGDRHANCVSLPRITMDGEQLLVCSQSVDSSDSLYLILSGCQRLPTSQNSHWWIQLSHGNSGQKQQNRPGIVLNWNYQFSGCEAGNLSKHTVVSKNGIHRKLARQKKILWSVTEFEGICTVYFSG